MIVEHQILLCRRALCKGGEAPSQDSPPRVAFLFLSPPGKQGGVGPKRMAKRAPYVVLRGCHREECVAEDTRRDGHLPIDHEAGNTVRFMASVWGLLLAGLLAQRPPPGVPVRSGLGRAVRESPAAPA